MKLLFILLVLFVCYSAASAQTVADRAKQRSKDNVNHKVDNTVDKGVDSAFNKTGRAIGNLFKKKKKKQAETDATQSSDAKATAAAENNSANASTTGTVTKAPTVNSNGDFEPGGTVIFEDHFEQDAIGDFPAQWNTNGSGSIVTIDGIEGKWLSVVHNSIINPVMKKALPENCTIEFDLFLQADGSHSIPFIQFGITPVKDILKEDIFRKDKFFMSVHRYSEENGKTIEYGMRDVVGNKSDFPLTRYVNKALHVAMAINKTRIRVYLDGQKLIDLPRAITPEMRNNFFLNNNYIIPASQLPMLVGNIRIASSDVDARSLLIKQLMEEGKTSTTDILFDVNSDVIKKESFEIVNQFGDALVKNPTLKIKITGHTDSDGADAANLELSKKRAAAVKTYITENYPVTGSRIQTDGKGETQPVAPNTTADGKAKNRRVEFVKL